MARVLIVDDTLFMRTMLKNIITEMGHTVAAEASTGEEAIEAYAKHKPDLITMDITMPDMDGITAVQKILDMNPKAKIIMCSAVGLHNMVLEAITLGAKDFIVKPFQKERVMESILSVLHP